jgi:CDP-2,3-bis-(O-geranylgeranyl)-sn-glycerol synthase
MLDMIIEVIYFLLPVYVSNMASVASAKIPIWNKPIISEKTKWRGKPIFGANKTWRGAIFGIVFGFAFYILQIYWQQTGIMSQYELHDYSSLLLGFLLASGAIIGDLVESFVKRRIGIKPGERFMPWDQIDHAFAAMVLALIVIDLNGRFIMLGLFLTFILHIFTNFLGFKLRLRKTLW